MNSEIDLIRPAYSGPPPMGLTGPSSLENVHWTFSRAFGPPKGKAMPTITLYSIVEAQMRRPPFPDSIYAVPTGRNASLYLAVGTPYMASAVLSLPLWGRWRGPKGRDG